MQPVVVQSGGCRGKEESGEEMKPNAAQTPLTLSSLPSIAVIMLQMMMVCPHPPQKKNKAHRKTLRSVKMLIEAPPAHHHHLQRHSISRPHLSDGPASAAVCCPEPSGVLAHCSF